MPTKFAAKKAKILAQLSVPHETYQDLSPKGSVDEGVRELCAEINALDGFVTTSSCAGRIAVYLEGGSQKDAALDSADPAISNSGPKGGGEWLYVSHDPIDLVECDKGQEKGGLYSLFGIDLNHAPSAPSTPHATRYVHFRFEPMILHILASSLDHAQAAHAAGLAAGFRESGISSISGPDPAPMVAIRTQGLFLSSIIGYHEASSSTIRPMVTEDYLRSLIQIANSRFVLNQERKDRFRQGLLKEPSPPGKDRTSPGWEKADERRVRLRAEGLQRRADLQARARQGNDVEQTPFDSETHQSEAIEGMFTS